MTARSAPGGVVDPGRYHESVDDSLGRVATTGPVCLYLETTNRCNLLCTTCSRTCADLEPEADMNRELFTRIVDQVPNIARVVLHGVGEPMLVTNELARQPEGRQRADVANRCPARTSAPLTPLTTP